MTRSKERKAGQISDAVPVEAGEGFAARAETLRRLRSSIDSSGTIRTDRDGPA